MQATFSTVQKAVLIVLIAFSLLLIYALHFAPYELQVTENHFEMFGSGEPVKIVLISDTQSAYYADDFFRKAIERINAEEPDLVLIAGDIVDGEPGGYEHIGRLGDIRSRHGVYAVLGNHDYKNWDCQDAESYTYADAVAEKVESLGITVLRNENRVVEMKGHRFAIVGVDDLWACRADYDQSISGLDPGLPRIILLHQNEDLYDESLEGKNLVLAGHTHCGQVDVPFITDYFVDSLGFGKTKRGWKNISSDDSLYVTCGLTPGGIRLFAPPEISVIYLD